MPPRKAKATPKKHARVDSTPPLSETSQTISKKRKIDWATIDETQLFEGFELKPIKIKTANKKQKTGQQATPSLESYRDAPLGADIVQKNPFPEGELSETHYIVTPTAEWESTSRYRKFTSKS
jgi:hypothetical protein